MKEINFFLICFCSLIFADNYFMDMDLDSSPAIKNIIENQKVTDELLQIIIENDFFPEIVYVVGNPNVSLEMIKKLSQHKNLQVRRSVAESENTPLDILFELVKEEETMASVASNSKIPEDQLLEWSQSNNTALRIGVAKNKSTPSNLLSVLAKDKNKNVRKTVAANENTPLHILEYLADDEKEIIDNIIKNNHTPTFMLQKIMENFPYTKEKIASHKNISNNLLLQLLNDSDKDVRFVAFYDNPNISIDILSQILDSEKQYSDILEYISESKISTEEILDKLLQKSDKLIDYIINNPNISVTTLQNIYERSSENVVFLNNSKIPLPILNKLAESSNEDIRCGVARHPNASNELLSFLSYDPSDQVRSEVALNIKDIENLKRLSFDSSVEVRRAVASNLKTPINILKIMLIDSSEDVKSDVACNPNFLGKDIEELFFLYSSDISVISGIAANPNTPLWILEKLLNHTNIYIKVSLSSNQNLSRCILESLAKEINERILYLVANHSNTPKKILIDLAKKNKDLFWSVLLKIAEQK